MPESTPTISSAPSASTENVKSEWRLSGRSRMGSCTGIQIAATGSYVPDQIVTNEDLDALGCDSDWIVQRTGIRQRRRAASGQATSDLAYEAAIRCLRNANVDPSEVDLIIVATITPDYFTPSTACLLQRRLGCVAPAMDVNAACAGFMYALVTAANFVRNGMAKKALVVGAEVMSCTINPADKKTYPLFGDGAGAALVVPSNAEEILADQNDLGSSHSGETDSATAQAVKSLGDSSVDDSISRGQESGFISYTLGAEGCGGELLCIPGGGSKQPLTPIGIENGQQYLAMDGRSVFKWAVRIVNDSCRDCMHHASMDFSQIDLVLLHQANIRIIDSAVADFGVPRDRVFVNLDRFGNTSAASIPLALDDANSQGLIRRGDHLLLCGFGAGLSWGTAVLRW